MQYFVISRTVKNDREKNSVVVLSNIFSITPIYLISTITTVTRMMMIITKIATIPIIVPIMTTKPVASSVPPCVLFTHTGGVASDVVASDVVGVIKSVLTVTSAKRQHQLRIVNTL